MKSLLSFLTTAILYLATTSTTGGVPSERELQASNNRVIAEAYECDEYLQSLTQEERQVYKPLGYEIRICVRPNTPTRNRGIVMRSLDKFTWYKNNGALVQQAILEKADQPRTLQVCIPGRPICSFKTKLLDDFFYGKTNGTVYGTGTASLQMENDADNPSIRRQLGADENGVFQATIELTMGGARSLEVASALGGFAGSSPITVEFNVDSLLPPEDFVPYQPEDISSWWQDAPTWLKVLIIFGAVILSLMGCCLLFMCMWSVRECMREEMEKKKAKDFDEHNLEQAPEGVQVNPVVGGAGSSTSELYEDTEADEDTNIDSSLKYMKPSDKDVCFDADEHPGTKAMHAAVKVTLKQYPVEEYSPEQYRHIKKQLPGRKFFVCDDEDHPDVWREVPKFELAELLRKEFDDMRIQQQGEDQIISY